VTRRRLTVGGVIGGTVVASLLTVTALLVASYLLGWRLLVVESGSMAPTFPVGSLAVVTPTDSSDLVTGSSIVFVSQNGSGALVSHRVVRRLETDDGLVFETRGDANPAADPLLVPVRDVRGSVAYAVPRAGTVLSFLAQQPVIALLILGPTAWLLGSAVYRRRRGTRNAPAPASAS
jgi:signal peptidase I